MTIYIARLTAKVGLGLYKHAVVVALLLACALLSDALLASTEDALESNGAAMAHR